ncbi:MAG: recombination protein RecR [Puniceicoccaceae bacterium]|nr:recombination protein RecR [Puniceicoccaceae bacterium]RCL31773.1 MAG: recombination protein RecR [Puniceicoccaceae bacterium]
MNDAYDSLLSQLRKLPGLGFRSAERIAIHLLTDKEGSGESLIQALHEAQSKLSACHHCGNICEGPLCSICANPSRQSTSLCLVESVLDLLAIERSGTWKGCYHVLFGKLSPIHGVLPEHLNLATLVERVERDCVEEIIFALSNDIESNATCHYIQDLLSSRPNIRFTQVGFGLPSGGGVTFADASTLKSAFESRRSYD